MARIAVAGLWHLGCVVAAGLASLGHRVRATDPDPAVVTRLQQGRMPVYEPGLSEAIAEQTGEGRLSFVPTAVEAFAGVESVFVTFDTPVDDGDQSDLTPVEQAFESIGRDAAGEVQLVLMSQVSVGTCRRLAGKLCRQAPGLRFSLVYQPENLRLGEALACYMRPGHIVIGAESREAGDRVAALFAPMQARIFRMNLPSAEMTKHCINSFLATSVTLANQWADLAGAMGADFRDIAAALRADPRIGERAYVTPGIGFSGGTLGGTSRCWIG